MFLNAHQHYSQPLWWKKKNRLHKRTIFVFYFPFCRAEDETSRALYILDTHSLSLSYTPSPKGLCLFHLNNIFVCVCVCACVCVCVHVHTHTHASDCVHSSRNHLFWVFLIRVSHWDLGLLIQSFCLANKTQVPDCLCHPSTGIIWTYQTYVLMLTHTASTLPPELSLQISIIF